MATPDVTVMGAGIFGLSCAWAMVRRGARVRVIDPHGPGAGASGGLVGALSPHVPENWNPKKQFQLESLLLAGAWWSAVEAAGGVSPGYLRSGRLQPLADAAAVAAARRRAETAQRLWGGQAEWRVVPLPETPLPVGSPSGLFIHDTLTARIAPRRALAALGAALALRGVAVESGGEAAGPVLWATGAAGLAALSADLGRTIGGGVKGQAALFGVSAPDAPQLFVDALHVVPHADGTVAIGSTTEREYDDPATTDAQLDALIEQARRTVPALTNAPVVARWAGLRPRAVSRAPILGVWPGQRGHFVANGGFKIGFGMAPKVAEVMADLVLDGRDGIPEGFRVGDCL
ncbi:MAG: hypothetical protein RLZZ528_2939 [Pseudomonadota bacterium]|jgi:glycine/D-amino acid oxidase-like deaminating enzyme